MSDTVKKIQDLLEKLKSVEFEDRGTGWKNIAPLGKLLKDNGICFTGKLQSYLSKFENSFEFHEDFSNPVKVVYVRAIQKNNDKAKREMNKYRLMDWAYLRDINDFCRNSQKWLLQNVGVFLMDCHCTQRMQFFGVISNILFVVCNTRTR